MFSGSEDKQEGKLNNLCKADMKNLQKRLLCLAKQAECKRHTMAENKLPKGAPCVQLQRAL